MSFTIAPSLSLYTQGLRREPDQDNRKGPPSQGGRIRSDGALGMYHPCLNGRDTIKPRVILVASHRNQLPRVSTYAPHTPALQGTQHPAGDVEGNLCGESHQAVRADSHTLGLHGLCPWSRHPLRILSYPCQQAGNPTVVHAHLVWKNIVVSVSVPPRPDLRVHSQPLAVML